jgi:hypothetical protein
VLIGRSLFVCDRRMVSANQGTAFKAPEISTPDRHPERRPSPLQITGSTPCLRHYMRKRTYKITSRLFASLPDCGKKMRLVSVTPARESVVFGYLCANDRVLEFTIGDR